MEAVYSIYNTVFYEQADPRVKDWLLMRSPWPIFFIIVSYLAAIKLVLPRHMAKRKAYDLKTIIKWYNVVQIIANAVVTWGIATSGWTTTYHLGCVLPDYSMNPEPVRMLRFMWWTIILKLLELFETTFFILRKKNAQASFLHVYHHVTTLLVIWAAVKYVGGGMSSFPPMLNNSVHVLMYSYYLLSSEGSPTVKAALVKYKKWLTIIQMIQFTVMLVHFSQVYMPHCPMHLGVTPLYLLTVVTVYYMFYDFYNKNYKGNGRNKSCLNGNKKNSF